MAGASDGDDGTGRRHLVLDEAEGRMSFLFHHSYLGLGLVMPCFTSPRALPAMALVLGAVGWNGWRRHGVRHVWLEDTALVEQSPRGVVRIPFADIVAVMTSYKSYSPVLRFTGRNGHIVTLTNNGPASQELRAELGRHLKAHRTAMPSVERKPHALELLGLR